MKGKRLAIMGPVLGLTLLLAACTGGELPSIFVTAPPPTLAVAPVTPAPPVSLGTAAPPTSPLATASTEAPRALEAPSATAPVAPVATSAPRPTAVAPVTVAPTPVATLPPAPAPAAATSAPTPTALPTAVVTPLSVAPPPGSAAATFEPLAASECEALIKGMSQAAGVQFKQQQGLFRDVVSGKTGTGCQGVATGTGVEFQSPQTVVSTLSDVLTGQGWQEDMAYSAGGPTGLGTGFRKGEAICLLAAQWRPDASANCPKDQPISACQVKPEQQNYTIGLNCAQPGSATGESQPAPAAPEAAQVTEAPTGVPEPTMVPTAIPTAVPTQPPATTAPAASTPAASGQVTTTLVIRYAPGAPQGTAQTGSCFAASLAAPRPGAWRCMVGDRIYDPCFGDQGATSVVCGADPIKSETGFPLRLSAPLPAAAPAGNSNQAWLVKLADGTTCGFATGATAVVNGERVNYLCQATGKAGPVPVLLGDLRPGTVWTAEKATVAPGNNGLAVQASETVEIQTVWQ